MRNMKDQPILIEPSEVYKDSYFDLIREFQARNEPLVPYVLQYDARDFSALIRRLEDESKGIGIPPDWVPASTFWLVDHRQTLIGVSNLRHRLTPFLEKEGGHIGYGVRPSKRRKGYATYMLKLTLDKAREIELERVMISCDKGNTASARVIEKNGGLFDSEEKSAESNGIISRYIGDRLRRT